MTLEFFARTLVLVRCNRVAGRADALGFSVGLRRRRVNSLAVTDVGVPGQLVEDSTRSAWTLA